MADLKIGMIGLDTSHVVAFARCLNDPNHVEHVPGGRVTHAFPGGSEDFELSWSRLPKFTQQLRDEYNVEIVETPQDVAKAVDLLFIMSVDGRVHLDQLKQTIEFRRPTFIDKPLATSIADSEEIFRLANKAGIPLMSCSSLRYAHTLTDALAESGTIFGCDVHGPMQVQPTQPGLFWYGIHTVEMVNRIMGRGCVEVKATTNDDYDLITATWSDGRMACVRGARKGHNKFGATLHREKNAQFVDVSAVKRSYYASMLEAILATLPHGKSDIAQEDTLEVMRFIEAANKSRENGVAVRV